MRKELERHLKALRQHHDGLAFRKAAEEVRSIWRLANGYTAAEAPWSLLRKDPTRAAIVTRTGVNLIGVAATVAWPFIPSTAERVLAALGSPIGVPAWPRSAADALTTVAAGQDVQVLPILFVKLPTEWSEQCTSRLAAGPRRGHERINLTFECLTGPGELP